VRLSEIDWWRMQPRPMRRVRLFFEIVWRMHEGGRMGVRLSWEIAGCMHGGKG
jgi:hypothetical protein